MSPYFAGTSERRGKKIMALGSTQLQKIGKRESVTNAEWLVVLAGSDPGFQ